MWPTPPCARRCQRQASSIWTRPATTRTLLPLQWSARACASIARSATSRAGLATTGARHHRTHTGGVCNRAHARGSLAPRVLSYLYRTVTGLQSKAACFEHHQIVTQQCCHRHGGTQAQPGGWHANDTCTACARVTGKPSSPSGWCSQLLASTCVARVCRYFQTPLRDDLGNCYLHQIEVPCGLVPQMEVNEFATILFKMGDCVPVRLLCSCSPLLHRVLRQQRLVRQDIGLSASCSAAMCAVAPRTPAMRQCITARLELGACQQRRTVMQVNAWRACLPTRPHSPPTPL